MTEDFQTVGTSLSLTADETYMMSDSVCVFKAALKEGLRFSAHVRFG